MLATRCILNAIIKHMHSNNQNNFIVSIKKAFSHTVHKTWFIITSSLVVISILAYSYFSSTNVAVETHFVKLGELTQNVLVTGVVQASKDANLSFQSLGVVTYVGVKVGDIVPQGKVLATLDSSDARATLLQAKSQLSSREAVLGQLTQGFRKEEIAVKQQIVEGAKNSLEQAYSAIPDTIRNVDSVTSDIVKNKLSPLFVNNGDRYSLTFSSCDQNLQSSIEADRASLDSLLKDYQKKSSIISTISAQEYVDAVFLQAGAVTGATNNLVNAISNLLLSSCNLQNPSLDAARITLSTVKVTMSSLFTEITTKKGTLNSAKNLLSQSSRDLELAKAGTDPYALKSQAALVTQAEAEVVRAESGLNKTIITAPFTGTISDISVTEGETVSSGKIIVSMLAADSFEVEAKIPEIDIAKVSLGAIADVTLDAYGKSVIFQAKITRVNPTATTESSVPMYKVIVTFLGKDTRIKSGMTANVNIVTQNKSQALVLPARFVEVIDESRGTVTRRDKGVDSKRDVKLGLRGQSGLIEIITGLVPGDEVVAPSTGERSAQKQNK